MTPAIQRYFLKWSSSILPVLRQDKTERIKFLVCTVLPLCPISVFPATMMTCQPVQNIGVMNLEDSSFFDSMISNLYLKRDLGLSVSFTLP